MIFDTHCHAYWDSLERRQDEVFRNMTEADVRRSVQIGTDLETSRKALDLARSRGEGVWCTAGMHPTGCQDLPPDSAGEIAEALENLIGANRDKIVAVGETGLDYYHLTPGRESGQIRTQKAFFREQAALAIRLDLPLVIHTRNAPDMIDLMRQAGVSRAVIHCFSENYRFAQELLSWSSEVCFSFSGILTYRNALPVRETARLLPLDRILVETDSPFLVPQIVRDRYSVNEPAFTRHVMDVLKTVRDEPDDLVEQIVWENSNRFYGL
ncbi:MAG: TatD family hydrolase [Acidobacteria bacterium]|nr:TatD family hydrolase [Acidobacteriota bacterium]